MAERPVNVRRHIFLACLLAAGIILGPGAHNVAARELKPGDRAPEFALPGSDGSVHRLSGLKGKVVVIAWFPKAFTGG